MTHAPKYCLNERDRTLVQRAAVLLERTVVSGLATPAQLVSIGKALHVLTRMPKTSNAQHLTIDLASPPHLSVDTQTSFTWSVEVQGQVVLIGSGGYFQRGIAGGDSFTTIMWEATPGEEATFTDFSGFHGIVPDLESFTTELPTVEDLQSGYKLDVLDSKNPLLEETAEGEGDILEAPQTEIAEDEAEGAEWVISPQDAVEQVLARQVKPAEVDAREPQFAYGVDECGLCGSELSKSGLMVDGRLKGSLMWGNLCAHCFAAQGEGLGNGVGQLYARQPDGQWRLVAGFLR